MATVIEYEAGHYEVHKTSYGEAYVWCHEYVVLECDCGERPVLSASRDLCNCGREHATLVQGVLASHSTPHPWEAEYSEWRTNQDELLLSEETYRMELRGLD